MPKIQGFKEWVDIFGFDKELIEKEKKFLEKRKEDQKPIRAFNIHEMMDHLNRLSQFSLKPPFQRFLTEMQWGTTGGALRLLITPKYHTVIQRLQHDLSGEPVWFCKKVYSIDYENYGGKEDVVANELYEIVQNLEKEKLERNLAEYDLESLAYKLSNVIKSFKHDFLIFQGIKELNENNYELYMFVRGAGVGRTIGARMSQRVNEYILDLSFNEQTGNVKVFFFPVSDEDEGGNMWIIQPPDFFQFFSSGQQINEIIDAVMVSLKCF